MAAVMEAEKPVQAEEADGLVGDPLLPEEVVRNWESLAEQLVKARSWANWLGLIAFVCFGLLAITLHDWAWGYMHQPLVPTLIFVVLLATGFLVCGLYARNSDIWAERWFADLHELGQHAMIISWNQYPYEIDRSHFLKIDPGKFLALPQSTRFIRRVTVDFHWPDEMTVVLAFVLRDSQGKVVYHPRVTIRRIKGFGPEYLVPNWKSILRDRHCLPHQVAEWFVARVKTFYGDGLLCQVRERALNCAPRGIDLYCEEAIARKILGSGRIALDFPYEVVKVDLGQPQFLPDNGHCLETIVGVIDSTHTALP